MVYFSNAFNIDPNILEEYGAFDISLINDLPLFIDPFLLYGSDKPEYLELHQGILDYLSFLRTKSQRGSITDSEISSWYKFSEVKQNWFGYCLWGNGGSGLGEDFGRAMSSHMHIIFNELNNETISETSHLEKATLFEIGVGRDNISDFTCNLIKHFLLTYTEQFAIKYLQKEDVKLCNVSKAYFDYKVERWMSKTYTLPWYNDDYIILTPRDILTKDDNWINNHDLRGDFWGICESIPNDQFRGEIHRFFRTQLPAPKYVGKGKKRREKKPTQKEIAIAVNETIRQYPQLIDYYIKRKEEHVDDAKNVSTKNVVEVQNIFNENVSQLIYVLSEQSEFYNYKHEGSYSEALKRVFFLKDVIENKDGYRLFYYNGQPIKREKDLQVMYRLTWYSTIYDVNQEVNNGRGPVDFKISNGEKDKSLLEFKLASNGKLKQNLQNQTNVYEAANNTKKTIKVILYFNNDELQRALTILKELNMEQDDNIVLIDAEGNKPSASNVK